MIIALLTLCSKEFSTQNWVKSLQRYLDGVAVTLETNRFREYRVVLNHKEERLRIPLIQGEMRLWPAGLLPRRPYPLAVYIFAVCLYMVTSDLSMRKAAAATCKEFGLEKFSHSTLSRARKRLLLLMAEVGPPELEEQEAAMQSSSVACAMRAFKHIVSDPFVYAVRWAVDVFRQHQRFLL